MRCWNKKCEYHNTGTCVTGVAKGQGKCNKKIPEGSRIKIVLGGYGSDDVIAEAILRDEMEIHTNAIMLLDGGLLCTDDINQLEDGSFEINCCLQDAYTIRNGYFIESITESD